MVGDCEIERGWVGGRSKRASVFKAASSPAFSSWPVWTLPGCWGLQHRIRLFCLCGTDSSLHAPPSLPLFVCERDIQHCQHLILVPELQVLHIQDEGELLPRVGEVLRRLWRCHVGRSFLASTNHLSCAPSLCRGQIGALHRRRTHHGRNCRGGFPRAQEFFLRSTRRSSRQDRSTKIGHPTRCHVRLAILRSQ